MFGKLDGSPKPERSYHGPEQRQYPRFEFSFSLKYTKSIREIRELKSDLIIFREEGSYKPVKLLNISLNGACFITPADLPPSTLLSLEVFSSLQRESFKILARVVWNELTFLRDYHSCL